MVTFTSGVSGSCPAGSNSSPAGGCPDGYQSLAYGGGAWQNGITVWRNNNYVPKFNPAYLYRIMPLNGNYKMAMDVVNGSTTVGTRNRAVDSLTGAWRELASSPTAATGGSP